MGLLSEKCKELVNSNHEIKKLETLCQELRSEIDVWKTKSQNLAKQCSSMASILSIQLGLKTSNSTPSSTSPGTIQKGNNINSPQASKKRRLTEVFVVKNDKEVNLSNVKKFDKSDHCYSNKTKSEKNDKQSYRSNQDSSISHGIENGLPNNKDSIELNSQNEVNSLASNGEVNPISTSSEAGVENGIEESSKTSSADPKPEICIPELPDKVPESVSSLPKPILSLKKTERGLEVLWEFETEIDENSIKSYELFALNISLSNKAAVWKRVGDINSIKLPIKVTLSDFKAGTSYKFAVRAKDKSGELGPYSEIQKIIL